MDGRISRRYCLVSRIFLPACVIIAALALPVIVRAQARDSAPVATAASGPGDAATAATAGLPIPAGPPAMVAMGDGKELVAGEDGPANNPPAPSNIGSAAAPGAGSKSAPPATGAPAAAAEHSTAGPAVTTPPPSALESTLIRSAGSATQESAAGAENSATNGPKAATADGGESSLYSRFASVGQVGGALAIVVGLIFIGRALVRKFVPGAVIGSGKGVMEILARYPLAKNQTLVLVRIGSQLVVLNQTRESSQSVLVIHDQAEVANILGQIQGGKPTSIQQGFSNLLANARMDLETTPPEQGDGTIEMGDLDSQLDEMAAAKRQLMELRQQVRSVRESLPTS